MKKNYFILFVLLFALLAIETSAQTTHIPDNNFLQALKDLGYGAGVVGNNVPTANIDTISSLDLSKKNISDLTGIQSFVALTILRLTTNQLTNLDLSKNTALIKLYCNINQLSSLDISKNTALQTLYCNDNLLSSLDVSKNLALKALNFANNQLPNIDVSANTALTSLYCSDNQIANIDVSTNTALTQLNCDNNQLQSLDVSTNTALGTLNCFNNQLLILDLSKNAALTDLSCFNNQLVNLDVRNENNANVRSFNATQNPTLSCIYVDDNTASYLSGWKKEVVSIFMNNESECGSSVAYTHIPDNKFLKALIDLGYGEGVIGNYMPTANIDTITSLDISKKNIYNSTGIQDFVALTKLDCSENGLHRLDVSKNTALTTLDCSATQLTSLDVSKNTALTELNCGRNPLLSLDVSKNIALTELYCNNNQLTSIDVSKNTALTQLNCDNNQLQSIDVSTNTALGTLFCQRNQLQILDLSKNTALIYLNCLNNQLVNLDVRNENNANVKQFDATQNPTLTCIYVDDKTASYLSAWKKDRSATFFNNEVECGSSVVYTLIPDNNFLQALKDLGYGAGVVGNNLPTANISEITSLDVSNKNISNLSGIHDFGALISLNCSENQLASLDVSKNTVLTNLECNSNQLTSLNLSTNTVLVDLNCTHNQITDLNLSKNTIIEELYCYNNQLLALDVSENKKLSRLGCSNNLLTSLDVRNGNNENITTFEAEDNPDLTCIFVDDKTASHLSTWKKDETSMFVNNEAECTTSVNDLKERAITVYPNPTTGILNIDFSVEQVQRLTIFDITGKTVFEKNKLKQVEAIDLSGFVNGIYFLIVQTDNESRSLKIIKE